MLHWIAKSKGAFQKLRNRRRRRLPNHCSKNAWSALSMIYLDVTIAPATPRSPAGASGRCDCPNRCDGTGCASPSAAAWKIADTQRDVIVWQAGRQSNLSQTDVRVGLRTIRSISRSRSSDRPALTSSALTADPRRADPGNLLAGAVFVLRRLSIMCNWPVALRGGGHIEGVV